MKCEVQKDKFVKALSKAERLTGKHISLPILKAVYCEVKKSTLIIRSTNLDVGCEITIPCKVIQEGVFTVLADSIRSYVTSTTQQNITLEVKEGNLVVASGSSFVHLKLFDSEEYPVLPHIEEPTTKIELPCSEFVVGLKSVWYAANTSSIRPELSSIYIYQDGTTLVFAATDSYRLSEMRIVLKEVIDFPSLLIPYKNAIEIMRIIDQEPGGVMLSITQNQISLNLKDIFITSRVIEGVFPDYKQIVPNEYTTIVTISKKEFESALRTSKLFSDKSQKLLLTVDLQNKQLICESSNSETGSYTTAIPGKVSGVDCSMKFNQDYVQAALQSIDGEFIELKLEAQKPMMIRDYRHTGFMYLVMQMNR